MKITNFLKTVLVLTLTATSAFAAQANPIEAKGNVRLGLTFSKFNTAKGWEKGVGIVLLPTIWIGGLTLDNANQKPSIVQRTKAIDTTLTASISNYGEDRMNVLIVSEGKVECSPFMIQLTGVATPNSTFELNEDQGANKAPLKVGEMTIVADQVFIKLSQSFVTVTKGYKGNSCTWEITGDTAVVLKRLK